MIDNFHTLSYNGKKLSELGAVIASRPIIYVAERDVTFESQPMQNGDVIIDNGRYKNITFSVKIRALFTDDSLDVFSKKLTEMFCTEAKYAVYRDTYTTGYYRYAFLTNISKIKAIMKNVYETTLTFSAKPFLYSDLGDTEITKSTESEETTVSLSVTNIEKWESLPIIKIIGTGIFTVVCNDTTITADVTNSITFDSERHNVYDNSGNACNDKISAFELPKLKVGENTITVTRTSGSGAFSVKVIPRWCRL